MTSGYGPETALQEHDVRPTGNDQGAPPPRWHAQARASRWLRVAIAAALIGAGAWAWWANWGPGAKPAMNMNARVSGATAIPVVVAEVARGPIAGTVTYTGSVAAFNEEDIYPRVTGRIVDMSVYPGDAVRTGQIVARLDDVELSWRLREAEAMARSAAAGRAQMEADLVAAEHNITQMEKELAMVEAELSYAQAVASRSEQLINVGAISRQEYESDRAMARSQTAKREAARAKVEQARAMEAAARRKVEAGDAMVAQSAANVQAAGVVRDYVNIVAPSAGYVVKRLVAPGVLVQPGMPILKTAQIDRVRLQANVGDKDFATITVGSPVRVRRTGERPGDELTARVTSVAPFADPGARTAVVEAIVENRTRRFLPGQYLTMEFVTGSRDGALTVPRGAVARFGGRATVWVVADGVVQPRVVTVGLESADRVEVVSGVGLGDRVVARGHENLYAGARVAVVKPPAAALPGIGQPSPPVPMPAPVKENPHAGH
jgi:multidrug efflux pump subunit AcrA (membrane-fusion protein)